MEAFSKEAATKVDVESIKAVKVLGKGAMGTVFLAYDSLTPSPSFFALKVVQKSSKPEAEKRGMWERSVLSSLKPHPFLPQLISSYSHHHDLIAWALPYCSGGDLNLLRHRQIDRVFSPTVIRFYLAEIVSALDSLHSQGIVYRDLKPENILIQQSGHITLTDFDLSKHQAASSVKAAVEQRVFSHSKFKPVRVSPAAGERSMSFVGTEEYVSPEMVRGEGHEFAVDWWALGVLAYEMLYGKTPFRGRNKKETFRNVLVKEPEFVGKRTALMDLIGRLLEKDPVKRLGYGGGAEEVRAHEFFNGLKWDLLTEVGRPPFVPSIDETEGVTVGGFDVTEYFKGLKLPNNTVSITPSMSSDSETDVLSLTEF